MNVAQLVQEYHGGVYRYAYRLTGSVADAEDLTQQVFLIAQQKLGQLRSPESARSWLFAILAGGCTFLMILLFVLLSVLCCCELYHDVVHGQRRWVFDRSRDLLTFGNKPMRSLSSIAEVVLTRGRVNLNDVYWVSIASKCDQTHEETRARGEGKPKDAREVRFSFGRQADAEEFARIVGSFVDADVVNKLA